MKCLGDINRDLEWRMAELASLKTIPLRYKLLDHHKAMLIKYAIPSIYSLWEGFVKATFKSFIAEINSYELAMDEVNINLIVHGITSKDKLRLENPRLSFRSKKEFVEHIIETFNRPFELQDNVPTNSNVNYEVINNLLTYFNLATLPESFAKPLNKLVHFRNSISHGEIKIPIKIKEVELFTKLLNDLMIEIIIRIEDGLKNKNYLKDSFS